MFSKKGFTLIELLVVISIIGMLSSVVLAALNGVRDKGRLAAGQVSSKSITNGLSDDVIAYFDFETDTSTLVSDSMGNGYSVSLASPATCTIASDSPTSGGKGLSCSGRGLQFLPNSTDAAATNEGNSFTYALWFKPMGNPTTAAQNGHLMGRFGCHNGPLVTNTNNVTNITNELRAQVWYNCSGSPSDQITIAPNPAKILEIGKWYFIVFAVDSVGNKATLFLDGQQIAQATLTANLYTYPTSYPYFIDGTAAGNYSTIGVFDKVGFYRKALNLAQVQEQYFAQKDFFVATE